MYSIEEAKKLRLDFWEQFGKLCEIHPLLQNKRKKWMLHRTKIKGISLRFEAGRENAKVLLELGHRNEDKRLKAYEILERYIAIVENGFENGLIWEFYHQRRDSGQEVCRIYTMLENVDFHRRNQWPAIFNFFIENMLQLEENFLAVSDILKEELSG